MGDDLTDSHRPGPGTDVTPLPNASRPRPGTADLEHPWLGLDSFHEEDRAYFFGRAAEIAEIHLRLRRPSSAPALRHSGPRQDERPARGADPASARGEAAPRLEAAELRGRNGRRRALRSFFGPVGAREAVTDGARPTAGPARVGSIERVARMDALGIRVRAVVASPIPEDSRVDSGSVCTGASGPPEATHLILDQFEGGLSPAAARSSDAERDVRDAPRDPV